MSSWQNTKYWDSYALLWKCRPKDIYICLTVLEIFIASAVINFNNGMIWILRVLVKLGVISDSNSVDYCNKTDKARIYQMSRKKMDLAKHQRKQIWAIPKGFGDQDE